jgi:probable rRNA maturation factor
MITIEPPSSPATSAVALSKPSLTRFLNHARTAVGLTGEVDVLLTGDAELKRLNRAYRGKNKATDVLSFPTPVEIAQAHAGDLAISLDTASRQAAAFSHSLDVEVRVLLLHGLLHLSGLDHETDSGEMAAREAELRTRLKLPVSLIDRITNRKPVLKKIPAAKKKSVRRKGRP